MSVICTSSSFDAARMAWQSPLSEVLGRVATQALVFNPTPGPDIIPRLLDAKVSGMAQLGMNINGVEEIDGVIYAQSWWCRAE